MLEGEKDRNSRTMGKVEKETRREEEGDGGRGVKNNEITGQERSQRKEGSKEENRVVE
jgi:hypothetical protein